MIHTLTSVKLTVKSQLAALRAKPPLITDRLRLGQPLDSRQ
jgi:hypothetical protein